MKIMSRSCLRVRFLVIVLCFICLPVKGVRTLQQQNNVFQQQNVFLNDNSQPSAANAIGGGIVTGLFLWSLARSDARKVDIMVDELQPEEVYFKEDTVEFGSPLVLSSGQYEELYSYLQSGPAWKLADIIPRKAKNIKNSNLWANQKEAPLDRLRQEKEYLEERQKQIEEKQRSFIEEVESNGEVALRSLELLDRMGELSSSLGWIDVIWEWCKILGFVISISCIFMLCGYVLGGYIGVGGIIILFAIVMLSFLVGIKTIQSDKVVKFNELSSCLSYCNNTRGVASLAVPNAIYPPEVRDYLITRMKKDNNVLKLRKQIKDEIISFNYNCSPDRLDYFVSKYTAEIERNELLDTVLR